MVRNSIQFSVVREDPQIEMNLALSGNFDSATIIGSGGCTAFCLKALIPDLRISIVEPNPAQIRLIKEKIGVLETGNRKEILQKFGVGNSSPDSLIERGNFESLFRQFRLFVQEFILSENEIENAFKSNSVNNWNEVFRNPYWSVAFELFFSDSILKTMFGDAAVQNAPKNSYPRYFQKVLENGLMKPDASNNYFLHHIFLGKYLEGALPFYLEKFPVNLEFSFFRVSAQDHKYIGERQLLHFSNIFDWCDEISVKQIIKGATANLSVGSTVIYRQLNNKIDYRTFFGNGFKWTNDSEIIENDRSLFYENIEIGEKVL